jgi:geranylgeranylglycerol-phosphate geranylgeranyltransferase
MHTRLWSLWAFLRPQIALQACLYALLGSLLSGAGPQAHSLIALLALACVVSFGFVSNDYADHELDRLTKPERFLPSGRVTRGAARTLGLLLVGVALGLSLALPPALKILLWFNLLLTAAYALRLKRSVLLGNLSIAYLNSSIILFGALLGAGPNTRVWCVVVISLLYSLAQEVLYTIDDYLGDQQAGILTTAGYFGPQTTLALFRVLIVIAALSTLAPFWLGLASPLYLLLVLICVFVPIRLWIWPHIRRGHAGDVSAACRAVKWVRVSSLAPLLALTLSA